MTCQNCGASLFLSKGKDACVYCGTPHHILFVTKDESKKGQGMLTINEVRQLRKQPDFVDFMYDPVTGIIGAYRGRMVLCDTVV